MIKSIRLANFQSHKDTRIEFSPGVNVIVGPSRNGKTAVLRALRWVVENRPSGDEFRSHWAGKEPTIVEVGLTDDAKVGRIKGNGVNLYSDGDEGHTYAGFGQEVPEPIAETLNLLPINFQYQFDSPFLLFDSPGQAARTLNQIVHLEKIDTTLANVESAKRQNAGDIRNQETRIAELEALEASFPDLGAAEDLIAELEGEQARRRELEQKAGWLRSIQNDLAPLRAALAKIQIPEGAEALVNELIAQNQRLQQFRYTATLLHKLQDDLGQFRAAKDEFNRAAAWDGWASELLTKQKLLQDKRALIGRLQFLQGKIGQEKTALNRKTAIILEMEADFKERMPGQCPLCGR